MRWCGSRVCSGSGSRPGHSREAVLLVTHGMDAIPIGVAIIGLLLVAIAIGFVRGPSSHHMTRAELRRRVDALNRRGPLSDDGADPARRAPPGVWSRLSVALKGVVARSSPRDRDAREDSR